jgi:hypothetical protein
MFREALESGEANLRKLAGSYDPFDRGTSPAGFT